MKIIEALKKCKDLVRKADDLKVKISKNCADIDFETPLYTDQRGQVSEWIQAHGDVLKEILRLKHLIQKTNVSTPVSIEVDGKTVTKSICEWIVRRKYLIPIQLNMYSSIGDRGLKEGSFQQTNGLTSQAKIRRYYDPQERDKKMESLQQEPFLIDSRLEIVNATTDLVE